MLPIFLLFLCICQPTYQMEGVIVSLPVKASGQLSVRVAKVKTAVNRAVGAEIHTWTHKRPGYQLECRASITTPGLYAVRVLFNGAQLETMDATRFDGELTKSVTIQSTSDAVHVVQYLKTDHTCVTRSYTAAKEGQGFDWTEAVCTFPGSLLTIHKTKLRDNGWIWGTTRWENWDKSKPGVWKGAIVSLPPKDSAPDPEISKSLKLHSWSNVVPGYFLTLYRVVKNSQPLHYIAIYYHMELLQSGVQITKFDDTLLNSVSVAEPAGDLNDQYGVQYKFQDGSCKDRFYSHIQDKAFSTTNHMQITEDTCHKFTASKFWNSLTNIDAINGWLY